MTPQEMLEEMIDSAWNDFGMIAKGKKKTTTQMQCSLWIELVQKVLQKDLQLPTT